MNEPKLGRFFCPQPFSTASVDGNGEVFLCCAAFLKVSAGNLLNNTFPEVWNSDTAQELRRTILDGTYSHCIDARCPFLQGEVLLPEKDKIVEPTYREIIDSKRTKLASGPRELHAAYDVTCNLSCPYCRAEHMALSGEELSAAEKIHNRVVEGALPITDTLVLSSQGDPFASKLYSKILREFDPATFPQLRIRMTTNGTLFTRENWESIRASHGSLEHIHVSVNGASKESFEANQRGASWPKLLDNLEFLRQECRDRDGKKRFVTLSFIVQKNNYREMPDFVRLVQSLGFDRALFGMIFHADRTYTDTEFAKLPVHLPHHPEHQEFLRVMSDPMMTAPEAYIVGGLPAHLPAMRREFGEKMGSEVSGAGYVQPEGVDWAGWARAQDIGIQEGVSAPRFINFSRPKDGEALQLTFDEFAAAVGLEPDQLGPFRDVLTKLHDANLELLNVPAEDDALTPLGAAVAGIRSGEAETLAQAMRLLFAHAAECRPAGGRTTYFERFSRTELDYRDRLYRLLHPRQRRSYNALPIETLLDIDIGYTPLTTWIVGHALAGTPAAGPRRERLAWSDFVETLELNGDDAPRARELLVELKATVAGLLGQPGHDGTPSPLQRIAEGLRDPDDERDNSAAADLIMTTSSPSPGAPTYSEQIAQLEFRVRQDLGAMLTRAGRFRLDWLPVPSLMAVEVGESDPMRAAIIAMVVRMKSGDLRKDPAGAAAPSPSVSPATTRQPEKKNAALNSAAARRAAMNPRLALSAFPVLLPHFLFENGELRYGDQFLRMLDPGEADFAVRCDGRTSFRDLMAIFPPAAGLASTAPYLTWLSLPLGFQVSPDEGTPPQTWLVISPHPDDAELSLGGTLLSRPEGVQVINAVCFSDLIHPQHSPAFPDPFVVNAVRRDEALLAGAALGMQVEFLGVPEFVYRELVCAGEDLEEHEKRTRDTLKMRLYHLIRTHRPTAVFAPAAIGNHADHRMVFDCIIEFVDDDLFPDTAFHLYEDFPYSASYQAVDDFLARFEHSYLDVTTHFSDTSRMVARKMAIVDVYRSQFGRAIAAHVKRAATRLASIGAQGAPAQNATAERYWTIGVMGMGGPAF